jgi:transposase
MGEESRLQGKTMGHRQYKQGTDRQQGFLLPPSIEEYVSDENPVRAIDSYVESLDLKALGFVNTSEALTPGQPAYDPSELLKLYLYGYLHRMRSSRRLEAECQRNLEVIWLLEGLRPSYKTIADFRKDNLAALKRVNQDFVQLCKELNLFGAELIGIDGSFFRGNVAKDSIYTAERLQRALKYVEQEIAKYLAELDQADQQEGAVRPAEGELAKKLEQLRQRQQTRSQQLQQLVDSGATQIAEVDPDARRLSKAGQGTIAGYNVQTAVDAKNKLLVVGEVTQDGNDERQLAPMALAAKAVLGVKTLDTIQDQGYFNGDQIKTCLDNGITPYVPEPDKQGEAKQQGRFPRRDFPYDPAADCYHCPGGKILPHTRDVQQDGRKIGYYQAAATDCAACPLRAKCVSAKTDHRTVTRWEHEGVVEAHRERMAKEGAEKMALRKTLCEHPFGTLKSWCGWTHFLLRGLEKVRAEFSLLMLCYNFKRVLSIFGLTAFRAFCSTRQVQKGAVGC